MALPVPAAEPFNSRYGLCLAAPKEQADNCYPAAPPAGQDVPHPAPGRGGPQSPPASRAAHLGAEQASPLRQELPKQYT